MQLPLLRIRFTQLKRQFKSLGWFYGLLLLLLLPLLIYVLYHHAHDPEKALYLTGLVAAMVLLVQFSRGDKAFVFNHLPQPKLNIFTEYTAFTIPFTLPILVTPNGYFVLGLLIWFGVVAQLKNTFQKTALSPAFLQALPADNFEWKSGFRQSYLLVLLLPVLALAFCWVKFVPLFLLWIFTTLITAFYQQCEPLNMLFAAGQNTKELLWRKLKKHTLLLLLFLVPLTLLSTFFHPEIWWVNVLFLLFQVTLLAVGILLKYTTYEPNQRLRGNSVLLGIAAMGTIIPVMLPIPLIFLFRNYPKAIRNLNFYFHDQDR